MSDPVWPLFDLRIITPRMELRPPRESDFYKIIELSDRGVHDPATMPFQVPWTDEPLPQRHRNSFRFFHRCWADFSPERFHLPFGIWVADEVIGQQAMIAESFHLRRVVESASWIGLEHQGNGYGKEMRQAVLHLAFAGLGATAVVSSAFWDNGPSIGVSRALGYEENGVDIVMRRGEPERLIRFRLTRERWEQDRRDDITIEGLTPALPLFGLA